MNILKIEGVLDFGGYFYNGRQLLKVYHKRKVMSLTYTMQSLRHLPIFIASTCEIPVSCVFMSSYTAYSAQPLRLFRSLYSDSPVKPNIISSYFLATLNNTLRLFERTNTNTFISGKNPYTIGTYISTST